MSLSSLRNLKELRLARNQISDIGALRGLTKLYYLDLRKNQIKDFTPLYGLNILTLYK